MNDRVMFAFTYSGYRVYLNADYIVGIVELEDGKARILLDGGNLDVDQTIDEVLGNLVGEEG